MAFLSEATVCSTRPSDGFSAASDEMVLLPSNSCWTSGGSDEADVRPMRSIVPVTWEPGTSSQLRTWPVQIAWACASDRFGTGLAGLVSKQKKSLAIG